MSLYSLSLVSRAQVKSQKVERGIMAECYDIPLDDVLKEISHYSPASVELLNSMAEKCGVQKAFYAAFVLVCLQAHSELTGHQTLSDITVESLYDYKFFEVAKDDSQALSMFDTLLQIFTHRSDVNPQA